MNSISQTQIIIGLIILVTLLILLVIFQLIRRSRTVNPRSITRRWNSLMKLLTDKDLWYKSIIDADGLLDEVLRKKRYHGKTTGERLVAAQRDLTNNDMVWFSHKLKTKITDNDYKKLKKTETVKALNGFKQALLDLEALNIVKSKPKKKKAK